MGPRKALSVVCLLLVISSVSVVASASRPPGTPLPKRLSAQAFSGVAVLTLSGAIVAVEGIHVRESPVGPFNVLVLYDMTPSVSGLQPVPRRLFVDNSLGFLLLQQVFNKLVEPVPDGSTLSVRKEGLTVYVRMGGTSLTVQAVTPVKPSNATFSFSSSPGGNTFEVKAMQFLALASGSVDSSLIPEGAAFLHGYVVPQARIELTLAA